MKGPVGTVKGLVDDLCADGGVLAGDAARFLDVALRDRLAQRGVLNPRPLAAITTEFRVAPGLEREPEVD